MAQSVTQKYFKSNKNVKIQGNDLYSFVYRHAQYRERGFCEFLFSHLNHRGKFFQYIYLTESHIFNSFHFGIYH